MLNGNRLLFTALGLVAAITVAVGWWRLPYSPTTQHFRYDDPRNGNYRPGGGQCDPSALARIVNAKVRLSKSDDCQEKAEEYRQSSDELIQQTRAANAAQAQSDIATQQLWMAWLQTLGGLLTLAAAVGAAIYARDAASHTRHANDIAKDSQRAWLKISVKPQLLRRSGKDGIYIRINFFAENVGQSAATHFELNSEIFFMGQTEGGAAVDERMQAKIEEWKKAYVGEPLAVLIPGEIEPDSIWERFEPPTLKWWVGALPNGQRGTAPMLLAAVFYRTPARPGLVQMSWRSWYLHSISENGQILSIIPEFFGGEFSDADLCVEPFRNSLVHKEYPANDDSGNCGQ